MKQLKLLFITFSALLILQGCTRPAEEVEPESTVDVPNAEASLAELPSAVDILQIQSDARYAFEQMFLPLVVYESDREGIISLLNAQDTVSMKEFLLEAWEYLTYTFIDFSIMEGTLAEPVAREVLGLGDEHITQVTAEMLNGNIPAFIISMLDIEQFLRSTYIGIVYLGNDDLQIFTLEQSHGFHMFCFVNLNTRGSFFEVDNNRDAFIEAIIYVLDE